MTRKRDHVLAIALSLSVALILLSCQPAVATEGKLPAMAQSPHIQVAPPLPGPLSMGVAVIQFRAENVKLIPVYGAAATSVVPRIGHLHITVDGANWHWVHANETDPYSRPLVRHPSGAFRTRGCQSQSTGKRIRGF